MGAAALASLDAKPSANLPSHLVPVFVLSIVDRNLEMVLRLPSRSQRKNDEGQEMSSGFSRRSNIPSTSGRRIKQPALLCACTQAPIFTQFPNRADVLSRILQSHVSALEQKDNDKRWMRFSSYRMRSLSTARATSIARMLESFRHTRRWSLQVIRCEMLDACLSGLQNWTSIGTAYLSIGHVQCVRSNDYCRQSVKPVYRKVRGQTPRCCVIRTRFRGENHNYVGVSAPTTVNND